MLMHI